VLVVLLAVATLGVVLVVIVIVVVIVVIDRLQRRVILIIDREVTERERCTVEQLHELGDVGRGTALRRRERVELRHQIGRRAIHRHLVCMGGCVEDHASGGVMLDYRI